MERIPAAYKKQLGRNIRAQRIKRKFTQTKLAKLIGVGQDVISKYEEGTRTPLAFRMDLIANALGCSINLLMPVVKKQHLPE